MSAGNQRLHRRVVDLPVASPDRENWTLELAVEEIDSLRAQLAECFRLAGADSDGDEDWRIAPRAAEAVRELRKDYDEACEHSVAKDAALRTIADCVPRFTYCMPRPAAFPPEHYDVWLHDLIAEALALGVPSSRG